MYVEQSHKELSKIAQVQGGAGRWGVLIRRVFEKKKFVAPIPKIKKERKKESLL